MRWTVATTIGETVGFGVPALAGGLAYALTVPEAATLPLVVTAGAGEGAILGFAQSRVLRRAIAGFDTRTWIVATAAAAALGWAVGMLLGVYGSSLPAAVRVAGLIAAAVVLVGAVGGAQWLVLRRYVDGATLWIPANAFGWLLGLVVSFTAMSLIDEGDPAALVVAAGIASGLGMGLVVAAVTGLALVPLLRPAPPPQAKPMRLLNALVNPIVRGLLRSPLHPLLSSSLLILTYTGRRTGRRHSLPVMYVRDERPSAQKPRRIAILPSTRLGRWAVGLAAANVVLVLAWSLMGPLGAIPGFISGLAGGVVALLAIGRRGERALTVFAAIVPFALVLLFVLAELLIGHD